MLLIVSIYPTQYLSVAEVNDQIPPAPEFISVVPDGDNGDYIFNQNDTVKIQYTSDRFDVEGLILVGEGSGLSWNITFTETNNFTKSSSLGPESVYDIDLNVTSYTVFVVYAWYNDLDNITMEVLDNLDGALGHQLWITEGSLYPTLDNVEGGTSQDDENVEFYVPRYENATIIYLTNDPENVNSTFITLSFANSTEDLYNESKSIRVNMSQTIFAVGDVSEFKYTINITQRLIFFTAFNEFGWERKRSDTPISHQITTGFIIEVDFFESKDEYTELDPIVFNVTITNSTNDDKFSYRYRYFENETTETPLLNWTETSLDSFFLEQKLLNVSIDDVNHTQNITIYNVFFELELNISNILEIQVFVDYLGQSYNASIPDVITIHDSKPEISLLTSDLSITNSHSGFIAWETSILRGTLNETVISSNTTDLSDFSIFGLDNYTAIFNETGVIIEGNHELIINVTTTFEIVNISDPMGARITVFAFNNITAIYRVDTENPTISFVDEIEFSDANGIVTVKFTFEDLGINPTGVIFATVSWGNGLAINVTSLEEATIIYRYSGTYTITLNATDAAGNINSISFEVTVTVPTTETSKNGDSPISIIALFAGFISIVIVSKIIRKRENF